MIFSSSTNENKSIKNSFPFSDPPEGMQFFHGGQVMGRRVSNVEHRLPGQCPGGLADGGVRGHAFELRQGVVEA